MGKKEKNLARYSGKCFIIFCFGFGREISVWCIPNKYFHALLTPIKMLNIFILILYCKTQVFTSLYHTSSFNLLV